MENEVELRIDYEDLRKWLACPECESRDAKVEEGSQQLYCPNCNKRQELFRGENQ